MPIYPSNAFLGRAQASGVLTLPESRESAPYKEMAKLGDTLSEVGLQMYKNARTQEINKDTRILEEKYMTERQKIEQSLKDSVTKDGYYIEKDGTRTPYSAKYTEAEKDLVDRLSLEAKDNTIKENFLGKIHGASTASRVDSITFEHDYRLKNDLITSKDEIDKSSSDITLGEGKVLEKANKEYYKGMQGAMEKLDSKFWSQKNFDDYRMYNGNAVTDSAILNIETRSDLLEWAELMGGDILKDPKIKAEVDKAIASGQVPKDFYQYLESDQYKKVSESSKELRQYITPSRKVESLKKMLSNLKENAGESKRELMRRYQENGAMIDSSSDRLHDSASSAKINDALEQWKEDAFNSGLFEDREVVEKVLDIRGKAEAQFSKGSLATIPPAERDNLVIRDSDKKIGERASEDMKGDPRMRPYADDPTISAIYGDIVKTQLKIADEQLNRELAENPSGYLSKYFSDINTLDKNHTKSPRSYQAYAEARDKKFAYMGVPQSRREFLSRDTYGMYADELKGYWNTDNIKGLNGIIDQMRNLYGSDFNSMLNQMDDLNMLQDLEGGVEALSAITWIPDPVNRTRAILALKGYEANKGIFETNNRTSDGKFIYSTQFNVASALAPYRQAIMSDSSPSSARRFAQIQKMVEARFYQNTAPILAAKGQTDTSTLDKYMQAAVNDTLGNMFDVYKVQGTSMAFPKNKVTETRAKAIVESMQDTFLDPSTVVDVDKMPQVKRMTDRFPKNMRNEEAKKMILEKATYKTNVLGAEKQGVQLGVSTTSGDIPVYLKRPDGTSSTLDIGLDEMSSSKYDKKETEVIENEKSFFERMYNKFKGN